MSFACTEKLRLQRPANDFIRLGSLQRGWKDTRSEESLNEGWGFGLRLVLFQDRLHIVYAIVPYRVSIKQWRIKNFWKIAVLACRADGLIHETPKPDINRDSDVAKI